MGDKTPKRQRKARRKPTPGGDTRTPQPVRPTAYQALTPNFSSDRPILSPAEDVLGRGPFSIRLANAFAHWHGQDSLVVALYGARGSGKTGGASPARGERPTASVPSCLDVLA